MRFSRLTVTALQACIMFVTTQNLILASDEAFSTFIYGDKEIGFFHEHVTYEVASGKCEKWAEGGSLIVIDDHRKQEEIENHIRENRLFNQEEWMGDDPFDPGYHVGAHDRNEEGTWVWVNEKEVGRDGGYQNWGPAEPNNWIHGVNSPGENCMSLLMKDIFPLFGFSLGTWIDSDCRNKKFFICQRDSRELNTKRCEDIFIDNNINIPLQTYPQCTGSNFRNLFGWSSKPNEQKWIVKNAGTHVEIEIFPKQSIGTYMKGGKLHVNKILIKWQSKSTFGSQHSFGGKRRTAEMQIIHEDHETHGRVIMSFFIQVRHNPANHKWDEILHHIRNVRHVGQSSTLYKPPRLRSLFYDSHEYSRRNLRYTFKNRIRYEVALANSDCGRVTWLIFPRTLQMSLSQLRILQRVNTTPRKNNSYDHVMRNVCVFS